ncbi:DEAD/DEAH box helicase [Vulcanisaeta sp. JCM 14467]
MNEVFNELREELRKALVDVGFERPTEIQSLVIPKALMGVDIAMQARTGSGKTAAYLLPIMNSMVGKVTESLVIVPTRELALQVASHFMYFNKYLGFRHAVVYGGVPYDKQLSSVRDASLVVATPGRLLDLVRKSYIDLGRVDYFVIDEVDRMLDMGFIDDVRVISSLAHNRKQTYAATATLPREVYELLRSIMRNPVFLRTGNHEYELPHVEQVVYLINGFWSEKYSVMTKELTGKSIVFTNTRERAYRLHRQLSREYYAFLLHGGMKQYMRERVLRRFRDEDGDVVLVTTDLASRGLDIIDVELIINFDVPSNPETYIHRIGRTARLDRRGRAVTLTTKSELHVINAAANLSGSRYRLMVLNE